MTDSTPTSSCHQQLSCPVFSDDTQHVILYYLYVDILPSTLASLHDDLHSLCTSLSLFGRIRLSPEGINGSNSGSSSSISAFITGLTSSSPTLSPLFSAIRFKHSSSPSFSPPPFTTLTLLLTSELTSTGPMSTFHPALHPTPHLSPSAFHQRLLHPSPQQLLLDVRNHYESSLGRFRGAYDPRIRSFAQLGVWVEQNAEQLRGRSVLMYCTGGVRCEKAAAFLKAQGVDDVCQLEGGVHEYLREYGREGLFDGRLLVYDARGAMDGGRGVVGRCVGCGQAWERQSDDRRCRLCRCLVLTCDDCASSSSAGDILCEEHLVMDATHERAAVFLGRLAGEQLEEMRELVRRCELWADERRGEGRSRRHRNRSRQLRLQRERIDSEVARRRQTSSAGEGETRENEEMQRHRSEAPPALLPYMPLLNVQ